MVKPSTFEGFTDARVDEAAPRPAVIHWGANSEGGLKLLEVEGELQDAALTRWSGVIGGAIKERATGIAVDLRGCRAVDRRCLSVLLAASAMLRARGGGGVSVVTYPGSALDRRLRAEAAKELPAYSSATGALASLREAE